MAYFTSWRFRPALGREDEFLATHGPTGAWVQLFRRADGYVGTELEPDAGEPGWYRTTDRWLSEDAYHAFRAAFAGEYAALDAQCEALTAEERFVRATLYARLG
ncbi:MAG TPA: hypothetical protein VFX50_17920, partial [Gemmatimonadales bacterium]|nr:hypothetical protein [Gemmatimonadales bacterium]